MKQVFKLTIVAAILTMTYSCSEDLLDNSGNASTSQPTSSLTSAQAENAALTNPAVTAAFVNGIYGQMVQFGSGGTGGHDDFGHKAYHVFSDFLSSDMALSVSTYGWYRASITEMQAMQDFTYGDNRQVWRYYYRIIRSTNNVIAALGGNDAVPDTDVNKAALAQAKTLRAHSYFYLAQFFQREWNPSEEILPLYDVAGVENVGKATAAEVYALMEKDLNDAISLFASSTWTKSVANEIDTFVTHQVLAMIKAFKGDWADAATLTQAIINASPYSILPAADVTNGFNSVYNQNSWMWGIDLTENIGLGLVSWWGQVDAFSYSYAWAGDYKVIDADLFAAIPANDARKAQFFDNPASGRHLQPLFKFYASNRIGGTSRTVTADYVYMRVEEAYLLNAEANARTGNNVAARNSLKAVVSQRVPDASYIDGLSGQALADEAYLQTRIELWGEGKSFFALKRNQATIVRGANHLSFVGVPIPYNDERLQFEIPQDEIQNNPFVNSQNQ
ncbi:MAG: RagB/SusD family nutrient uptake outer membrane protein [Polaribacter sp.]|jgi:hypothetical protein